MTASSRELIYQPITVEDLNALPPRPHIERFYRRVPGGRVEAWFIPSRKGSTPAPLVIFAHGNSAINDWWAPLLEPYADAGYNVLMVEYRGYGRSDGVPTQDGLVSDIIYFYDLATKRNDVDAERVYLHGHSLGAAVVSQLSRFRPARAIAIQAPFTSVPDIAAQFLIPGFWIADKWDTLKVLRKTRLPVMVFHGKHDAIIPIKYGRRLAKAARNGFFVELDCGHNDCKIQWPKVLQFFGDN